MLLCTPGLVYRNESTGLDRIVVVSTDISAGVRTLYYTSCNIDGSDATHIAMSAAYVRKCTGGGGLSRRKRLEEERGRIRAYGCG